MGHPMGPGGLFAPGPLGPIGAGTFPMGPTIGFPNPIAGLPDILISTSTAGGIGGIGGVSAGLQMPGGPGTLTYTSASPQPQFLPPPCSVASGVSSANLGGAPIGIGFPALPSPAAAMAAMADIRALTASGALPILAAGPVLLVSNLNESIVSPENLFVLFGVYGDVLRVKVGISSFRRTLYLLVVRPKPYEIDGVSVHSAGCMCAALLSFHCY